MGNKSHFRTTSQRHETHAHAQRRARDLTRAIDSLEGLLLEKYRQVVACCDLLRDLHDHQVLVDLRSDVPEVWGELILVGGNLPAKKDVVGL